MKVWSSGTHAGVTVSEIRQCPFGETVSLRFHHPGGTTRTIVSPAFKSSPITTCLCCGSKVSSHSSSLPKTLISVYTALPLCHVCTVVEFWTKHRDDSMTELGKYSLHSVAVTYIRMEIARMISVACGQLFGLIVLL